MPMIDLTFVQGSVDSEALGRLTDDLVTALLRAEKAPDTPFMRDSTVVYLHPLDPAAQSVGGRGPAEPRFRIDLTVFEGALSQDRKEQLVADVHAAVCAAAGIVPAGARAYHVWSLIHEVPEGNWAGGGKIIYYKNVKGLVDDGGEASPTCDDGGEASPTCDDGGEASPTCDDGGETSPTCDDGGETSPTSADAT